MAASVVFVAMSSIYSHAQKLMVLPSDPAVRTEVMPNGLRCYIVTNSFLKGMVDFALVQNVGARSSENMDSESVIRISRDGIASQKRLLDPSVQDFFTSLGAVSGRDGFVRVTDDATIYHFRNVNLSARKTAIDSSLLVMMGIVEKSSSSEDTLLRKWYAPSDQAIIIAGDVDAATMIEKLRMLSYMVTSKESSAGREYEWVEGGVELEVSGSGNPQVSCVSATWRLPRTPRAKMNTIQPMVVEKYMSLSAIIAENRIKELLRRRNIPYAEVLCNYIGPANHLDDNRFTVEVKVGPENVRAAVGIIAAAISSLADGRVGPTEFKDVESDYFDSRLALERSLSNATYIARCASAFLYNQSLSSAAQQNRFLMTRDIPTDKELDVLKSMNEASFKKDANLKLTCGTTDKGLTEAQMYEIFCEGWTSDTPWSYPSDTLALPLPVEKMKVKSVRKEYLTGGSMWTMSNGLKVVVKHTDAKDLIHWSFILRGGYGNVADIQAGEAAYFSDYLDLCRIAGADSETFRDIIRRHGMTMDIKVDHSTTRLSGTVPDDGIEYLLKVLLAVMNDTSADREKFEYRKNCEALRLASLAGTLEDRIAVMDSVMCPDYRYTACKGGFSEDFMEKAERLHGEVAGRTDSGVLVLMGDIDEKQLKAALAVYSGLFRTLGRSVSRPVVNYQPISGTMKLVRTGDEDRVDVIMSAPISLTSQNYYTAQVMSMCLTKVLSQQMTGNGMHIRLKHECTLYPQERVSLMLSLGQASVDGFATGTCHQDPSLTLWEFRELLKTLHEVDLTDEELSSYKALLKQRIGKMESDPVYWQNVLGMRYAEGKDFHTDYKSRIDSITKDDVRNMLKLLAEGSRVEYLIENKQCITEQ